MSDDAIECKNKENPNNKNNVLCFLPGLIGCLLFFSLSFSFALFLCFVFFILTCFSLRTKSWLLYRTPCIQTPICEVSLLLWRKKSEMPTLGNLNTGYGAQINEFQMLLCAWRITSPYTEVDRGFMWHSVLINKVSPTRQMACGFFTFSSNDVNIHCPYLFDKEKKKSIILTVFIL